MMRDGFRCKFIILYGIRFMQLKRFLNNHTWKSLMLCVGMSLFAFSTMSAQDLYFVYFKDKAGVKPDTESRMSRKGLERRAKHGLPEFDWYDLPLNAMYVETVEAMSDSLRYSLRWLNATTLRAYPDQINQITALPFVKEVVPFDQDWEPVLAELPIGNETLKDSEKKLGDLYALQRAQMNLDTLSAHGLSGKGVRIAIFDAGFKGADDHPAFTEIFKENRVIANKDFFGNKKDVYFHSGHGTSVFSCIAGQYKNQPLGAGSNAEFLLARTESLFGEKLKEEDHWLAAMEWADANGADIINSSLGYTKKRYEYSDMDGRTTRVTQAANIAVRKGILVVNSQGNNGDEKFHFLGAPADADSVLSVGGTYPMLKMRIKFSSFGPNARKVLKPNVAAPGAVVAARPGGKYKVVYGTSFSSPLMAGFAAATMELYPEKTNMELFEILQSLGHSYPYFDYAHGYGVPDAANLFHAREEVAPTFELKFFNDTAIVIFDSTVVNGVSAKPSKGQPFYVHFQDAATDTLTEYNYFLIRPKTLGFAVPFDKKRKGTLRVWFAGYLYEEEF